MEELRQPDRAERLKELTTLLSRGTPKERVTLLFAARDPIHNNAMVLKDFLENLIPALTHQTDSKDNGSQKQQDAEPEGA